MASPPTRRGTTPIKHLASTPHSALCPAGGPSWLPDPDEAFPAPGADHRCTCGAGFLRLLAGGVR